MDFKLIYELPQIPFEVYYRAYNKTVYIDSSCARSKEAFTIGLEPDDEGEDINKLIYYAIDKAFESPGIIKINICRKGNKQ